APRTSPGAPIRTAASSAGARRPGRAARRMGRRLPLPRARRPRTSPGPRHHDRGDNRRTDPASHRGL
ncbi:MAG: hypothetical protein AVDCRST_MAG28-2950, partial [uncultured Rubrobacteraceae bacterium]